MTRTDHAEDAARQLIDRAGRTYAQDAGITLKNTPSPLFELLVLALLLSTRISADIAVAAARELFTAGYRTPEKMARADWQKLLASLPRQVTVARPLTGAAEHFTLADVRAHLAGEIEKRGVKVVLEVRPETP